ncbi:hypothetical protein LCGC14_2198360 [marine sediment metagenome]|uniref:ParB/Sulfiredoxin domain-containing protein n=1 Tax=marine sediment metagenome TaxID=412755 RepID=A0A0F9DHF5_9ZZZZ
MEDFLIRLVQSIEKHGLYKPIEKFEGKILLGRHRWYACKILGIEIRYIDLNPKLIDPKKYVEIDELIRKQYNSAQLIIYHLTLDNWKPKVIEKGDRIALKEELIHTKDVAKRVSLTEEKVYPDRVRKIKKIITAEETERKKGNVEKSLEVRKKLEELKAGVSPLGDVYGSLFVKKKPKPKKKSSKNSEAWKEKYLDVKKKYLDVNSRYNKIVSYMKENDIWDKYVKNTYPIAEKKENFEPTIQELRKSKI